MIRWEYRTIKFEAKGFWVGGMLDTEEFEYQMNHLGNDGWELVSCFDTSKGQGMTRDVIAVFKREKSY